MRILLLFFLLILTSCKEKIVSNLDEVKTNQILISLAKYGVKANKVKEGSAWGVEVEKNDSTVALEVLSLGRFLSAKEVEEPSSSFVKSKVELDHFLERKLSRSLEETLQKLPFVLEARVHISSPEHLEFSKDKVEKTASVLIVLEHGHNLDNQKVQKLVSGASGLNEQNVLVVSEYAQELIPIARKEEVFDKRKTILSLIPILTCCLIVVRRFDYTKKKNKEVKKILKIEDE